MPQTDTAYIIGVIREKEKELLQADEYTRLIDAPNATTATQSLVETVYGPSFEETNNAIEALPHHLQQVRTWLEEMLDDERVLQFIDARYKALQKANQKESDLASIAEEMSQTLHELAHTPLMHKIADLFDERLQADEDFRQQKKLPDDATLYEKEWDERLLTLLREYRDEPVGYDAIIAFWLAKEIETRTIRLLLLAKTNNINTDKIHSLVRSRYLDNPSKPYEYSN